MLHRYSVFVVDDRPLPRIAARAMLKETRSLVQIGEASSGSEAVSSVPPLRPDVVLMDVEMPGMDGPTTARRILELLPNTTVVAWTVSEAGDDLLRMVDAGCAGYVLKDMGPMELERAILAAIRREAPVPRRMLPEVLHKAARANRNIAEVHTDVHLTDREVETLRLIARGEPTKRIALEMGIAQSSVDTHLRNVYRKLEARNRGEAVNKGLKLGILSLPDL